MNFLSADRLLRPAGGREPDRGHGRGGLSRHGLDWRYINCEVRPATSATPSAARAMGWRRLQLLAAAQGRRHRAPRRPRRIGRDHGRGQLRRPARRQIDRREHRRQGLRAVAARRSVDPAGKSLVMLRRRRRGAGHRRRDGAGRRRARSRSSIASGERGRELVALLNEKTPAAGRVRALGRRLRGSRRRPTSSSTRPRSASSPTSTPGSRSTFDTLRPGWSSPT